MASFKSIRLSSLSLAFLVACSLSASAQPTNQVRSGAPARNEIGTSRMLSRSLDLTEAQAKKLDPVLKEQQARMFSLRTNRALSRQERMAEIQSIRKIGDEKMKPHLTPEQIEKWQQMRSGPAAIHYGRATNRFSLPPAGKSRPEKADAPPAGPVKATNTIAAPASQASQEIK